MSKRIIVAVFDGDVEDVSNIPDGVVVEVRNYDIRNTVNEFIFDTTELEVDEFGDKYLKTEWKDG